MRKLALWGTVCASTAVSAWAQTAPKDAPTAAPAVAAPATPYSAARLQALRQQLMAKVAAYDVVDGSYRAPTPAEQAAMAAPSVASSGPRMVALPGGAVAVKGDAAGISLLVLDVQADGSTKLRHTGEEPAKAESSKQPAAAGTHAGGARHAH